MSRLLELGLKFDHIDASCEKSTKNQQTVSDTYKLLSLKILLSLFYPALKCETWNRKVPPIRS